MASGGRRPSSALRASLRASSFARTVFIAGEPAAMFGVVELANGDAIPWALTTDVCDRYPVAFFKTSRHVLAALQQIFPRLFQFVDARYYAAVDWLERLGFQVAQKPEPFGFARLPFYRVEYPQPCVNQ
jgi:hypothetical protein